MALLIVNDPDSAKPQAGELLKQMFRLTSAEVRLVGLLLQGSTLQEACAHLQISIDTGRTHLKAIFGKLGIRRQADIIRVLGNMHIFDYDHRA
jgi:DNA-binding CsgD family transcriptional regulator